jgi:hypothetical protein
LGSASTTSGPDARSAKSMTGGDMDRQWNYERGRTWALLAPKHVQIRRPDGKLNPEAKRWLRSSVIL